MAIKNLLKFLTNYSDLLLEKNISDYKGKTIAIDISILLYKFIISIRNSGSDLVNKKGEIVSHILGLFNKTILLLNNNIIPIYVFDGKPSSFKNNIINNRKNIKLNAFNKMNKTNTYEEHIRLFKKTVVITKSQMDDCRELLTLMGVPYINAPEEADSQCAYLARVGLVDGVFSEDMDILTFGSPIIIKNLISPKKNTIEINLNIILNKLQLTHEQFIDFCILLGSDYLSGLSNINSNIIFKYYNKNKNIKDTLIDLKKNKYKVPENFDYDNIKKYFQNGPYIETTKENLELKNIKYNELLYLLVEKYGLLKYIISTKLLKIISKYSKATILNNQVIEP